MATADSGEKEDSLRPHHSPMVLKLTHVSVIDTLLGQIAVVRGRVTFKSDSLRDPSAMGGGIGEKADRDGIS